MKNIKEFNIPFGLSKEIILLKPYSVLTIDKMICNRIYNINDVVTNGIKLQVDYFKNNNLIKSGNILFAMLIDGGVDYKLPILLTYINIPEHNVGNQNKELYYDKMQLSLKSNYNVELPNFSVTIYYRDIALNII